MSSCSITNLTPSPLIFFCILPSIADIAAVKPNGANTFLANGIATFINGPANLLNNVPKNPHDCINFFICALLNFKSVAILLFIAFLNLVLCLVVNNNSCGSSSLLKIFILIRKVVLSLFVTAFFNLLSCKFVNLTFTLVYSTIYTFCKLNCYLNLFT